MTKELYLALADFDEEFVLESLKTRLQEGEPPLSLLKELQKGMNLVGERYEKEYYLSELMLSADLFNRSMEILTPCLSTDRGNFIGRLLIGTPKGDIHDLGKNIFVSLARAVGFEVMDLGVNVPIETFVEKVVEFKPDILGFSGLLTPSFTSMKEAVDHLIVRNLRASLKIIVGGAPIDQSFAEMIGADGYAPDPPSGVKKVMGWLGK